MGFGSLENEIQYVIKFSYMDVYYILKVNQLYLILEILEQYLEDINNKILKNFYLFY